MMGIQNEPGMPPPGCGQRFIALWASEHKPGLLSQEEGIDEYFGVTATITFRTGIVPEAQLAERLIHDFRPKPPITPNTPVGVSMETLARQIVVAIIKNRWNVLQLANARLNGVNGFVEPLRWLGTDISPKDRGPDWFDSDVARPDARDYGLSMDIRFGECRRLQTFANME